MPGAGKVNTGSDDKTPESRPLEEFVFLHSQVIEGFVLGIEQRCYDERQQHRQIGQNARGSYAGKLAQGQM